MKQLIVVLLVVIGVAIGVSSAKNREVKIKLKRSKERIEPGGTGTVTVRLKNRTKEPKSVTVTLHYRDLENEDPIGEATIDLGPKEKVARDFDVPVPADWFDRSLRVVARIPDAEAKTKLKTVPGEFTDELWLRGRELLREECGTRCHGTNGGQVRGRSLQAWISAVRNGPGSMPRFPDLSRTDIVLMRLFARDPKREVE
jgi:hypothetical protein